MNNIVFRKVSNKSQHNYFWEMLFCNLGCHWLKPFCVAPRFVESNWRLPTDFRGFWNRPLLNEIYFFRVPMDIFPHLQNPVCRNRCLEPLLAQIWLEQTSWKEERLTKAHNPVTEPLKPVWVIPFSFSKELENRDTYSHWR